MRNTGPMNCFESHNIKHLSPSTCNTFVASPALFVLQKCMKIDNAVGPAAHRGTAVEDGVAHGLFNPKADIQEAIEVAYKKFDTLTALKPHPAREKERYGIPGMVRNALLELRPYGVPSGAQGKVSVDVEGLHVPNIGYWDFEWEQHGIGIDLKTTHQLASKISINHARQVSLYRKDRGWKSTRVCYTTPKKVAAYEAENLDFHFESLTKICFAIQNLLTISDDPKVLASLFVPDVDTFYFNDSDMRQAAFEVFGI